MDVEGRTTRSKSHASSSSTSPSPSISNLPNRTSPRLATKPHDQAASSPLEQYSSSSLKRKRSSTKSTSSPKGKQPAQRSSKKRPAPDTEPDFTPVKKKEKRVSFSDSNKDQRSTIRDSVRSSTSTATMPKKPPTTRAEAKQGTSASKPRTSRRSSRKGSRQTLETFDSSSDVDAPATTGAADAARAEKQGLDSDDEEQDEEVDDRNEDDEDEDEDMHDDDEEDLDDEDMEDIEAERRAARMFTGGLGGSLRALGGFVSGVSARLKTILANLKNNEDPSIQLIALQDLAELLSVATEDTIAGAFSPDAFVKELVAIMRGGQGPFGDEDNPETMLLACRCLSNMMEAIPSSVNAAVYGGAVPVLCSKLLEIQYIDLAEQALSTLEKISQDFPASIVREGGLAAVLMYLDFFSTNVQRTAVTTAANSCRNIPVTCISMIKDVMPTIQNILQSPDQKVLDQACICVVRIIDSFKHHPEHLESIVTFELLTQVNQILLSSSTVISNSTFIHLLRSIAHIARSSSKLTFDLLNMHIGNTLFQVMTGLAPEVFNDGITTSAESDILVLQSLVHRPKEHIAETLNIIGELMPGLPKDGIFDMQLDREEKATTAKIEEQSTAAEAPQSSASISALLGGGSHPVSRGTRDSAKDKLKRIELLQTNPELVKQFAALLLPVLIECFSSTVNLQVRQRVVIALLKMIYHLQPDVLKDVLRNVSFASFLASTLSQQDHSALLIAAIQMSNLLMDKMPELYHYHFRREGVMFEISKLADAPMAPIASKTRSSEMPIEGSSEVDSLTADVDASNPDAATSEITESAPDSGSVAALARTPAGQRILERLGLSMDSLTPRILEKGLGSGDTRDWIIIKCREFREVHIRSVDNAAASNSVDAVSKAKALQQELEQLANGLKDESNAASRRLLDAVAKQFVNEQGIFSFELQQSGLIDALLSYLTKADGFALPLIDRQRAFLNAFLIRSSSESDASSTSLAALIKRLQESLGRSEPFEVVTAYQSTLDEARRNPASMLAKQIRLKLVAEDGADVPKAFSGFIVSIHAIATFKALDDYLKPRLSGRSAVSSRGGGPSALSGLMGGSASRLSNALAAFAAAAGIAAPPTSESTSPGTQDAVRDAAQEVTDAAEEARERPSNALEDDENEDDEDEDDEDHEAHDEDEEDDDEDAPEEAIFAGDFDEEPAREGTPGAESGSESLTTVNLAEDGTKMVATKEDGTKISTPKGPISASASSTSLASPRNVVGPRAISSPSPSASRSYAAVVTTGNEDWHLEFSINDEPLSLDTTVYKAVHGATGNTDPNALRNVWSIIHTIKFKKVAGPASRSAPAKRDVGVTKYKGKAFDRILRLLSILYKLNSTWQELCLDADIGSNQVHPVTESAFVNAKLTAKMNRQLEEALIVASACLPTWSQEFAHGFPFLFPFETRYLFLQSTSFGYARSMSRWQSQNPRSGHQHRRDEAAALLGRMQRQKVRIIRSRLLESAVKVMELYGSSQSLLEVEYFDEVGTGLGPTLEFYANVSREFAKKKLNMWRDGDSSQYVFSANGLFPRPFGEGEAETPEGKKVLNLFKTLGQLVAKALLDSRIVDISFNSVFMRLALGEDLKKSVRIMQRVDPGLGNSLKMLRQFIQQKGAIMVDSNLSDQDKGARCREITVHETYVEDLALDFTLPGHKIDLVSGGSEKAVTIDNVEEYFDLIVDFTLKRGVKAQVEAFQGGFSSVFPIKDMQAFTADEMVMLFGSSSEDWSTMILLDSLKADHGFTMESNTIRNLVSLMSKYTEAERREFLQFITGSPKLPIGGFKSLNPSFTIVCKPYEAPLKADDYLPSVMTCVNYLKLPDYSSEEVLKKRLDIAIKEGQGSFHLS